MIVDKNSGLFQKLYKEARSMDIRTPMDKIVPLLDKSSAVIITKNGEYLGLIDTKTLYRSGKSANFKGAKASDFVVRLPKITPATTIDDAVYYFSKARAKALPYVYENKVKGLLERTALLRALLSLGALSDIKVSEAMTTPVMAISSTSNVAQARSVMRDNHINRLAVLDGNNFVGIVTNRDITTGYRKYERLPELKSSKSSLSNIPISEIIERQATTLEHNRPASDAAREFVSKSISSVIITKSGAPIGILTVTDILESLVARKRIEPNRIFISGLHSLDYDYESEVRSELSDFITELDKLERGNMEINYITLNIKKHKVKSYELQARLSMGKRGILTVHANGYLFEETLKALLSKLKKEVMKGKELSITIKKSRERGE